MLFLFLGACFSEPQYTLPESESQKQPSLLGDETPPEPGNDGMNGEKKPPPPNDEFSDSEGLCSPVASSLRRYPAVAQTGLQVAAELSITEGTGALLVELVRNDPEKGSVVVYNVSCNLAVSLTYRVPKNIGSVYAVYFADKAGDGPTEDDIVGMSDVIDTTKGEAVSHSITLKKDNSILPLQLPFFPISEEKQDISPPDNQDNGSLPPPVNEPETGLPEAVEDRGAAPKEVPNIEEAVVEPTQDAPELPPEDNE